MNPQRTKTLCVLAPLHKRVLTDLNAKNIYNMESLLKKKPSEIKEICIKNRDPLAWAFIIDMARECNLHLSDNDSWVDFENARSLSKAALCAIISSDNQYYRVVQILYNSRIMTLGDIIEIPPSYIKEIEYISAKRFGIIENLLFWSGYYPDTEDDLWKPVSASNRLTNEEINTIARRKTLSPETYRTLKYSGVLTKETIREVEGLSA